MQNKYKDLNEEDSIRLIMALESIKHDGAWAYSEITLNAIGVHARDLQLLIEHGFVRLSTRAGRAIYVVLARVLFPHVFEYESMLEKTISLFYFSVDKFIASFVPHGNSEEELELDEKAVERVFEDAFDAGLPALEFVSQYVLKSGIIRYDQAKQKHLLCIRRMAPVKDLRDPLRLLDHIIGAEMRAWQAGVPLGAPFGLNDGILDRSLMFAKFIGVSPAGVLVRADKLVSTWSTKNI